MDAVDTLDDGRVDLVVLRAASPLAAPPVYGLVGTLGFCVFCSFWDLGSIWVLVFVFCGLSDGLAARSTCCQLVRKFRDTWFFVPIGNLVFNFIGFRFFVGGLTGKLPVVLKGRIGWRWFGGLGRLCRLRLP